ncbi:glycine receptor subunit alpha-2-like [Petromyzon marinus]|uniref:glycine receptor subunit alpha-2-like n=1 Tax=Petromyzon marinus TaxID=7757 RepID=UPI003F70CD97
MDERLKSETSDRGGDLRAHVHDTGASSMDGAGRDGGQAIQQRKGRAQTAATLDFRVDLILWQHWRDYRLAFKQNFTTIDLDNSMSKSIWIPDLHFVNEKTAFVHDTISPNSMLRLSEDGSVLYSMRISLTLSCPMNLQDFPMDTQVCPLYISSSAYTKRDLVFMWDEDSAMVRDPSISLPQYSFMNVTLSHSERHLRTGNFSMLKANFKLRRLMGFYLTQTYLPSALLVLLSWISFWINPDAAPARVALGITTVLTLTTQSSGARSSLPKVSRGTAATAAAAAAV